MQAEGKEIANARARVRIAEQNVTEQRAHIAELERRGHDTLLARELLSIFEDALRLRQALLDDLLGRK